MSKLEEKNKVFYQMGKYTARINSVKGCKLGYYGQTDKQGDNWYDIYLFLIWCLECDYQLYESRDLYHWGTQKLIECIKRKKERFGEVI